MTCPEAVSSDPARVQCCRQGCPRVELSIESIGDVELTNFRKDIGVKPKIFIFHDSVYHTGVYTRAGHQCGARSGAGLDLNIPLPCYICKYTQHSNSECAHRVYVLYA